MKPHKPSFPWVGAVVTLSVLGAGLVVILTHDYDAVTKAWATGMVGLIVGHYHGARERPP